MNKHSRSRLGEAQRPQPWHSAATLAKACLAKACLTLPPGLVAACCMESQQKKRKS